MNVLTLTCTCRGFRTTSKRPERIANFTYDGGQFDIFVSDDDFNKLNPVLNIQSDIVFHCSSKAIANGQYVNNFFYPTSFAGFLKQDK